MAPVRDGACAPAVILPPSSKDAYSFECLMSAVPKQDGNFGFQLYHLSPCIGTEVHGIDLGATHDESVFAWLSALLVERKVLFFRDQAISIPQHITFARGFGELEVHPFTRNDDEHPEVIRLDNDRDRPARINVWHSDVTWRENPSLGSILRARVVPEVGGDTLFANMEAAYDGLDDDTKERIEGLIAVHDNRPFLRFMKRAEFPPMRHPVVRTHPVSGRKSIYVNRTSTRTIVRDGSRGSRHAAAALVSPGVDSGLSMPLPLAPRFTRVLGESRRAALRRG